MLVGAFVLPTMGMGVFGHQALLSTRDRAGDEAVRVATEAERDRLAELTGRSADRIEAELRQLQAEVEDLRAEFEGAEPTAVTGEQRAHLHNYDGEDTAGLPAYGRFDPAVGVYADFEHRGDAAVWVPRGTLKRQGEPGFHEETIAALHRCVGVARALARFARHGAALDLAWVVTDVGVTINWPPYDFYGSIRDNPSVVDLDEASMDYVQIAAPTADPGRAPRWTDPYIDRFKGVWMTSVVSPIYLEGQFRGTVGADLRLSAIRDQVLALDLHGQGYPVLVGPHGEIIATTNAGVDALAWTPEFHAALLEAVNPSQTGEWSAARERTLTETHLHDAPDEGRATLAKLALAAIAGEGTVEMGGSRQLVAHAPIATSGWGLAIVVPEATVAARADAVRGAVELGSLEVHREFTVFGVLLFVVGLGAALLLERLTIRPLEDLARRVEALTFDHLRLERSHPQPKNEIGHLEHKVEELLGLITRARDGERDEHARLGAVLAAMADAVIATDASGRVRLLNPRAEALIARPRAQALGAPLVDVLDLRREADGTPLPDLAAHILSAGTPVEVTERVVTRLADGERAVEVRGAPLAEPGSPPGGVVVVLRDVTHARRVEDELMRVQKLETVRVLAAGIAHDFNNLLAGVLGYVSLARAIIDPDSPAQDRLERAEGAVDRARGLTLQLLTFSRGGEPVRTLTDLRPVITDAAELALRGASSQLEFDVDPHLWSADVDAGQIGQVVQNLVINAAQAMPDGGRVQVRARNAAALGNASGGRFVEISVHDHGAGIPRDQLSRIFDPFYTTKARGSGLGLPVCFSIVSRHGGRIDVESEVGVGSTFRVWLPAAGGGVPAVAHTETRPSLQAHVLFMDDDEDLRDVLAAMLRRIGCDSVGAADGAEAVRLYREARDAGRPFTLVMLDLTVPGRVGGVEALRQLRAIDPDVRAIVCSGYGEDPVLAQPRSYGFRAALRKPYNLARLAAALQAGMPDPAA